MAKSGGATQGTGAGGARYFTFMKEDGRSDVITVIMSVWA